MDACIAITYSRVGITTPDCVRVCLFIKLRITVQSGPVILVILCHSHSSSQGGINDTYYICVYACMHACMCLEPSKVLHLPLRFLVAVLLVSGDISTVSILFLQRSLLL